MTPVALQSDAPPAEMVLGWCIGAGVGFEVRPEYPGLARYAVVEIRGGLRVRYEADSAARAWAGYLWARGQRDQEAAP